MPTSPQVLISPLLNWHKGVFRVPPPQIFHLDPSRSPFPSRPLQRTNVKIYNSTSSNFL